ncbi:MAG: hypothetical protein JRJ39_00280 [Deltaproteobacteria bacterium]|nr:hypothetical protein [Deltaproteobacteria bacterium]
MDNLKKTLPSGSILEVTLASFEEGNALMKAVVKEVESLKISLGDFNFKNFDINSMMSDEMINTVKNYAARMVSSDEIETCLWKCIGRARYDNQPITKNLFEKPEKRGDYLIIMKEVLVYNLVPFFSGLGSVLSAIAKTATQNIQK